MYSVELLEAIGSFPRRDEVVKTIEDEYDGWISYSKIRPDAKDLKRVKDFIRKATTADGVDPKTIEALANRMAKAVKKLDKALRRGAACEAAAKAADPKVRTALQNASEIFYAKAIHLSGGPAPQYGSTSAGKVKSLSPKKEPPAIPPNLLPKSADDWELYSSMKGVGVVARGLTSVLGNVMKSLGKALMNAKTKAARGKAAQNAAKRMSKALEKKSSFGAADTEPLYQARWRLREYAALCLGTQESALQFDYPEIYNGMDWL